MDINAVSVAKFTFNVSDRRTLVVYADRPTVIREGSGNVE